VFLAPGYVTWHSAFIVTASGQSFAIVGKYDRQAIEETGAYDQVLDYVESVKQPLQQTIQKINPRQIAINYSEGSEICDGLTHGMFLTLTRYMEEIGFGDRIISAEKIVSAMRERKSSTEIQHMKDAIDITQQIFGGVTAFIKPGKTEKEIADFMSSEVARRGLETAWSPDSCPSVFTGPDTAEAHYGPTDRKVAPGHILNMDFGVRVNGYCSDMQRTFYVLKPGETSPPAEVQKGFDTIVDAVQSSMDAMKPGIQAFEVDAVSREILKKNGYDEFPHALGHQVGRFAHDGTAILGPKWEKYAQKPFQKLEPGMVFTIEPRLTVPDYGVATIEEMVVVTETGAEWLSKPQKEIILISS
jgi:Xaa-Pro aminopeptidase